MTYLKKYGISMQKLPRIRRITYLKNSNIENKMDHSTRGVINSIEDVVVIQTTTVTEKIYEELKNILSGAKLNSSNLTNILINLMQIVETYPKLSGIQKKEVILASINMLIDDQNDNVEDSETLKILVKMTLPSLIDNLVKIDKKQLSIKIKQIRKYIFSCCWNLKSIKK